MPIDKEKKPVKTVKSASTQQKKKDAQEKRRLTAAGWKKLQKKV